MKVEVIRSVHLWCFIGDDLGDQISLECIALHPTSICIATCVNIINVCSLEAMLECHMKENCWSSFFSYRQVANAPFHIQLSINSMYLNVNVCKMCKLLVGNYYRLSQNKLSGKVRGTGFYTIHSRLFWLGLYSVCLVQTSPPGSCTSVVSHDGTYISLLQ